MDEVRAKFNAGTDKAHKTIKEAESVVHYRWTNKMGKMLGIVNPALGIEWFELVTSTETTSMGVTLGIEKLHHLRCSSVPNETKCKWLKWCVGPMSGQFGIPKNDKDFRLWVAKETWLEYLFEIASKVLAECMALRKCFVDLCIFCSNFPIAYLVSQYLVLNNNLIFWC